MQIKTILPLLCGLFFLSTSFAMAKDTSKVLVSVGNETLSQEQFKQMIASMLPDTDTENLLVGPSALKHSFLVDWAYLSIMSQEAKAQGIDQEPSVQKQLKGMTQDMTQRILVKEFIFRNTSKVEVTEKDILVYYDIHKSEYSDGGMVRVQHILIRVGLTSPEDKLAAAKAKIVAIQARLDKGESFYVLAQKMSDDSDSKMNGGDLGFFGRGIMIPEFEEVAFNTRSGEISAPIQTQFGWHLIKVTDTKAPIITPLANVREEIISKIQTENQQSELESILVNLQKKYSVTFY